MPFIVTVHVQPNSGCSTPAVPVGQPVRIAKAQTGSCNRANNHKCTSKSAREWLKNKRIKLLQWPSQSLDLNLIEMLWQNFVGSVWMHANHNEPKQCCKEEWTKFPPQQCERLITWYRFFFPITAAKGGCASYWIMGGFFTGHASGHVKTNSTVCIFHLIYSNFP